MEILIEKYTTLLQAAKEDVEDLFSAFDVKKIIKSLVQ
jgi:hypothetical protein